MDYKTALQKEPQELLDWVTDNFIASVTVPVQIDSAEAMDAAAEELLKLSSYYSFLATMSSAAKINARLAKDSGDKKAYAAAVDKKEIVQNAEDAVKMLYSGISRAITVRTENLQELRMNASGKRYRPTDQYGE